MSILLDTLTSGAVLFLTTLGLVIVFGMMRIINFAHGAFLTVGAYATVLVTQQGFPAWSAFLLAPVLAAALGAVTEPLVMRRLYNRPLDTILATWGLSLVVIQLVTIYFGRGTQAVRSVSLGSVNVLGTTYSTYRLVLVPIALVMLVALLVILKRTSLGLIGRAVIMNEELAQTLGVHTVRVRFVFFTLGSAITGFAGALLVPLSSVDPNLGLPWLINAFMISLLVGVSTPALGVAALGLGLLQVLVGDSINAVSAALAVPIAVVALLRFRPAGLMR